MENPQPSYYAIIPASVRYNKNIEANAKLLYGEITALANMHGYCWATDAYFAQLYDVDERTVKRWIQSLKSEKLIKVETDRSCFLSKRKIWITPEIQKMFTSGQKCPDHGDKNVPPNNTSEYEKKNNIKRKKSNAAPPITYDPEKRKLLGISQLDVEEWQKTYTSINVRKEIDRCTIWARDNGRENYFKALMAFFRNAEKSHTEPFKERTEPEKEVTEEDVAKNKKTALEVERMGSSLIKGIHYAVNASSSKIDFIMPNGTGYEVSYHLSHEEFKKKCLPALKKMKLLHGESEDKGTNFPA